MLLSWVDYGVHLEPRVVKIVLEGEVAEWSMMEEGVFCCELVVVDGVFVVVYCCCDHEVYGEIVGALGVFSREQGVLPRAWCWVMLLFCCFVCDVLLCGCLEY